jgi:hypothetical protein
MGESLLSLLKDNYIDNDRRDDMKRMESLSTLFLLGEEYNFNQL